MFFSLTEDEIDLYKTYINDFEIRRKEWLSTKKKIAYDPTTTKYE